MMHVGNSWGHKHREVGWKDREEWGGMEKALRQGGVAHLNFFEFLHSFI